MVRSAVASRLRYWTESTESNHQVKVLLEVLKKLHRVRVRPATSASWLFGSKYPSVSDDRLRETTEVYINILFASLERVTEREK